MSAPPLLLGAAILFWGWQTSLSVLAVPLALGLEAVLRLRLRRELSEKDFFRLSDACTLLFVGLVVYAYATRTMSLAIISIVSWIPLCYYPQLLAQKLSGRDGLPGGAFFWFLRRRPSPEDPARTDLSFPFFLLCILSGAAANRRTPAFYAGMFALACWALWSAKPRARDLQAAGMLILAGAVGFAGQSGLFRLQAFLEREAPAFVFGSVEVAADPFQSQTAIGRIGAIKQSDAIALRVVPERGERPPKLLRQASYDVYRNTRWSGAEAGPSPLAGPGPDGSWELAPGAVETKRVRISQFLRKGEGLLALPPGTWRVAGLAAGSVGRSRLGAVSVQYGPPLAAIEAFHAPGASGDAPATARDLSVPPGSAALLKGLAGELGLDPRQTREALDRTAAFFQERFRYSTFQKERLLRADPLEDFLLRTRSGHCEYFATAGTLLLRAAGIPARYATGYSVQEYSRIEGAYIARQRHAHAWVLVQEGGVWRDFAPTPSPWAQEESKGSPWWSPVRDFGSWVRYRLALLRGGGLPGPGQVSRWALLALLAGVIWAARRRLALKRNADGARGTPRPQPGLDSDLYRVEAAFAARGWGRNVSESWGGWERRLSQDRGPLIGELPVLIALHEKYRFDPAGLTPAERGELRAGAERLLSALA